MLEHQLGDQFGPGPGGAAVEGGGLDGVFIGAQSLLDDDLIAAHTDLDHQVVGIARIGREHEIGGGNPGVEGEGVGAVGIGLVDHVGAVAQAETIGIVAEAALQIITAGAAPQIVVARAAKEVVVAPAARHGVGEIGAAHGIVAETRLIRHQLVEEIAPRPDRAVGEFVGLDDVIGIAQGFLDDDAVTTRADLDHHVVDVGRIGREREIEARNAVAKDNGIGSAAVGLVDAVGAVAKTEPVGVVAAGPLEIIVARLAGESIGAGAGEDVVVAGPGHDHLAGRGAVDHVVAERRRLVEQLRQQIVPGPHRRIGEFVRLDGIVIGAQRIVDDDLVAADANVDHHVGGIDRARRDREIGGENAGAEHDLVGAAAAGLVDHVSAVAAGEGVGIVAGAALERVVARVAGEGVIAGPTNEGINSGIARQGIVAGRAV